MTDIVEHLKGYRVTFIRGDLIDEAVGEIERLRAKIQKYREICIDYDAEIGRLRAILANLGEWEEDLANCNQSVTDSDKPRAKGDFSGLFAHLKKS